MADHRYHSPLDRFVAGADKALRVVAGVAAASRPTPAARAADAVLSEAEQRHSAGLMRVNHVGEVCAQALYNACAQTSPTWFTRIRPALWRCSASLSTASAARAAGVGRDAAATPATTRKALSAPATKRSSGEW